MQPSLRHLRMFHALARTQSVTRAADACLVSQPAVTQAIRKLEAEAGMALCARRPQGVFLTPAGEVLARRVERALRGLDEAMADLHRAVRVQATRAQLTALVAVCAQGNVTLAARALGLAQPTVHRSAMMIEQAAGVPFFTRTAQGLVPTRPAQGLAQAARLAFAELDQAAAELAALAGREVGRIVIGSLPLSRSGLLPGALLQFRARRPGIAFEIIDGRYDALLGGLRRGEIDLVVGALRLPSPVPDIAQERLFDDSVVIVARHGHPLLAKKAPGVADLAAYPWVLPRRPTPIRATLDAWLGADPPRRVIETSSVILLREVLCGSDHLGALSRLQLAAPSEARALAVVPVAVPASLRPIGITTRAGWEPTGAQRAFLDVLRAQAEARR